MNISARSIRFVLRHFLAAKPNPIGNATRPEHLPGYAGVLAEFSRALAPRPSPRRKAIRRSAKTPEERASWDVIKAAVRERSGGQCEIRDEVGRCALMADDPHHVFGKSHESVPEVLDVCRSHHEVIQNAKDPSRWWRIEARTLARLGYQAEAKHAYRNADYSRAKARLSREAEERRR